MHEYGILLAQVLVCLLTFCGLGGVLLRLSGQRGRLVTDREAFLAGVSGLCLGWLFLQNLVYLEVPVVRSGWTLLVAAAVGLWLLRDIRLQRRSRRALGRMALVGVLVASVQGFGLLKQGPSNYYGFAHHDQVNYVQLAEFLARTPFDTPLTAQTPVWMVKAHDLKPMRIGQSVANAYVSSVTLTSAKQAYGVTSIVFLVLLALASMAMASSLGAGPWLSVLVGMWVGLLPAVTLMHLDGFLSQAGVMFAMPSLVVVAHVARRRLQLACIASMAIVGWVLAAYTEILPIVLGCAAVAGFSAGRLPLAKKALVALAAPAAGVLLVPEYAVRALGFTLSQYSIAKTANPLLDGLVPSAGTLLGWAEHFALVPDGSAPARSLAVGFGLVLLVLMAVGLASHGPSRRTAIIAVAAPVVATLALLLARADFAKYPFAKISVLALPFATYLIVRGIEGAVVESSALARHLLSMRRRSPWAVRALARRVAIVVTVLLVCLSLPGTLAKQMDVVSSSVSEPLGAVDTAATRRVFEQLEASRGATYTLRERHPIVNAWLAYHARHATLYSDVEVVGDRVMPADQFAFRRPPSPSARGSLVFGDAVVAVGTHDGGFMVEVANPQGDERAGDEEFYWLGDQIKIFVESLSDRPRMCTLTLLASPGPAHPDATRTVQLSGAGQPQQRTFERTEVLSFGVPLAPGTNELDLAVLAPTEWLVKLPGDPRKHMVRVSRIAVEVTADPRPVAERAQGDTARPR